MFFVPMYGKNIAYSQMDGTIDITNNFLSKSDCKKLNFVESKIRRFDKATIDMIVKTRNKLAHGDYIEEVILDDLLSRCVRLSLEIFSIYFFARAYDTINLPAQIFSNDDDKYFTKISSI